MHVAVWSEHELYGSCGGISTGNYIGQRVAIFLSENDIQTLENNKLKGNVIKIDQLYRNPLHVLGTYPCTIEINQNIFDPQIKVCNEGKNREYKIELPKIALDSLNQGTPFIVSPVELYLESSTGSTIKLDELKELARI